MKAYQAQGNPAEADCVIGHSFGTSINEDSVNRQLAEVMLRRGAGLPLIADRTLVNAFPERYLPIAHVVEGAVTNIKAQGVGTWGTLVEARKYMDAHNLQSALMIAQAYHISRVMRQASRLCMTAIVPEGLPRDFDKESDQIWTKSAMLWVPFNALGSLLLKRRGQL